MGQSTVSFDIDGSSSGSSPTVVNGPGAATQPELLPEWVTDLTASLGRVTYRAANNEVWQWQMTLTALTTAQKNALVQFYREEAKGSENSFVYTHTDGTQYQGVRFIDTPRFTRIDDATWDVDIRLEIDGSLNS